ncbi:MAG TPA: alpha/beta hydrolase [Burkholderiales bacterium]|nr:alpha/beta hydrolase [Burkholderiales bacterium]
MFDGFTLTTIDTGSACIRLRTGGNGPALLLLHGNPQTHVMWHAIAPALAKHFTVVATDLTGYGMSSKPASSEDHAAFSKRSMAKDQVAVMRQLGHEQFMVAGHDRGGRVAYRMALDHPGVVKKIAVLDVIPTLEAFERGGKDFGLGYYHWFFLAQPAPLPETLINADPEWFWRWHTDRVPRKFFSPDAVDDYLACFRNPETVRAICEDYRAGATIDCAHDAQDRDSGRRIACPLLALWGKQAKLEAWYDTLSVWREWASDVSGGPLDCGHYLAEERPAETSEALISFFS